MKRRVVQSLLMALALVLLQACVQDITAAAPKSVEPPKSGAVDPMAEAPVETAFFMRGFSPLAADEEAAVGHLEGENGAMIGTAVLITPHMILTAGHCLDDTGAAWFVTNNHCYKIIKHTIHPYYKIGKIMLYDVAVAWLEEPCCETPLVLVTAPHYFIRTEPLTTIGYGGGIKRKSNPNTFHYFGTVVEDPTYFKFIPFDGTVWFGDSGGAVLNSNRILVGIISSFTIFNGHLYENSATRLDLVSDWIAEQKGK
jgi:hypothetical protein